MKNYLISVLLSCSLSFSQEIIGGVGSAGQPLLDYVVLNYKSSSTLGCFFGTLWVPVCCWCSGCVDLKGTLAMKISLALKHPHGIGILLMWFGLGYSYLFTFWRKIAIA